MIHCNQICRYNCTNDGCLKPEWAVCPMSNANQRVANTDNVLGGWISVKDRLPEPDTDVLARRATGMEVESYHKEGNGWWTWDVVNNWRVTHWMPLPEPPEVDV